ncbi:MAG: nucleotidyl transferase AbiEii/AbiGii toxin family protein [Spirochaetes bacterium]|nr:nucleotidyl transferase AbiEii/AbiGii toxin family protein [Spirochaetota bacterium]
MTPDGRAISVHDRLLNQAHAAGEDFNLLVTHYALERFLYRISMSVYKDRFLLKGALLFDLWFDTPRRPTRDADLLGFGTLDMDKMAATMREICAIECDDGMVFLGNSVKTHEIREDASYGGIRVDLLGMLGNARCPIQIDVGFGDIVTPKPIDVLFPTILDDNPAPALRAYPKETVIAEKLEAIVVLGMANSRMKDYFDLHVLFSETRLDVQVVRAAISATFKRRETLMSKELPIGLTDEFAENAQKIQQWNAFLYKNRIDAPALSVVVEAIRRNAGPLFMSGA